MQKCNKQEIEISKRRGTAKRIPSERVVQQRGYMEANKTERRKRRAAMTESKFEVLCVVFY